MSKKIIVGNWKMNPESLGDAKKIFSSIALQAKKFRNVETVICPPAPFMGFLIGKKGAKLGAQDSHFEMEGAFTGSISPKMMKSAGCEYAIIGHSEKRQAGDTDELVNKKVKAALKCGLRVVLCVGENNHDESGEYLRELKAQVLQGLEGVAPKYAGQLILAHEPVWAIGINAHGADTPASFQHNRLYIKKTLTEIFGKKKGVNIPVLYGGSVNPKNAKDFIEQGDADGLLVGRASLVPSDFLQIVALAN